MSKIKNKELNCLSQLPDSIKYPLKRAANKYRSPIEEVRDDSNAFFAGAFFILNNPMLIKNLKQYPNE